MTTIVENILNRQEHEFLRGIVLEKYSEPHRKYHNLSHLEQIFTFIERNHLQVDRRQIDALLLHDLVFDPERIDNEEESVKLAYKLLKLSGVHGQDSITIVCRMILDTQFNSASIVDSGIVIDCDLSILASGEEEYFKYLRNIKEEYSFLNPGEFSDGRAKWIRSILYSGSMHMFQTEFGRNILESKARLNLQNELKIYE